MGQLRFWRTSCYGRPLVRKGRYSVFKNYVGAIAVAVLTVSFVANAQNLQAGTSVTTQQSDRKPLPFRGSTLSYTHSATATTFAPGAEPHYNPTWVHRLGLLPEYHFNDYVFARARFWLSQELTLSDTTTYKREFEPSDVWLEAGTPGWQEPNSKIRISGDVRAIVPTSKASQAQTRIFSLGPSASLSRGFDVLSGLTFIYTGRFTYRWNRFTAPRLQANPIGACGASANCPEALLGTGRSNVNYDLLHGAIVSFNPLEKLNVSASYMMQYAWLYPESKVPDQYASSTQLTDGTSTRFFDMFSLSVSYTVLQPLTLTLGSFTFSEQLQADGKYVQPFFNRNTTVYLDVSVDVEAAVSSLLSKS